MQSDSPVSQFGRVTRGLTTLQLLDVYYQLKMPYERAAGRWPMSDNQKPVSIYNFVKEDFQKIFKFDMSGLVLKKNGEPSGKNLSSQFTDLLTTEKKNIEVGPYYNATKDMPFSRRPDEEVLYRDERLQKAEFIRLANHIDGLRSSALANVRALLGDQNVRQIYARGDNFDFPGAAQPSKGLAIFDALKGSFILKTKDKKRLETTPAQKLAIIDAVMAQTGDAQPGAPDKGQSEPTKSGVDKVAQESSGIRGLKLAMMIRRLVSLSPNNKEAELNEARNLFRGSLGFQLPDDPKEAKEAFDKSRIVGSAMAPTKDGTMVPQTQADTRQVHKILSVAFQRSGKSLKEFMDFIWRVNTSSTIGDLLNGVTLAKPLVDGKRKWVYEKGAASYVQAQSPSSISFGQAPEKMAPGAYTRYAFDKTLYAFVQKGANGDQDGGLKIRSTARKPVTRTKGLRDSNDPTITKLISAIKNQSTMSEKSFGMAVVEVIKKVHSRRHYNKAALVTIANTIGAPVPEFSVMRDPLESSILNQALAVYLKAAEDNNQVAIAICAAALGISADVFSMGGSQLGSVTDAIRAKLDAHHGVMSEAACLEKGLLTNEERRLVGVLQGKSIPGGATSEEICNEITFTNSSTPLSGNRSEPKTVKVTSGSRTPSQKMAPKTMAPAAGNLPIFGGQQQQPMQQQQQGQFFGQAPGNLPPIGAFAQAGGKSSSQGSSASKTQQVSAMLSAPAASGGFGSSSQQKPSTSFQFN